LKPRLFIDVLSDLPVQLSNQPLARQRQGGKSIVNANRLLVFYIARKGFENPLAACWKENSDNKQAKNQRLKEISEWYP
jgi:hypothetical protein